MVALTSRVGIIGAGAAGLYLAKLLLRQGYQVDIFEKSPQPRTEGCGILLVSSGLRALQQGIPELSQKIIDIGVVAKTFEFRNLKDQVVSSETETYAPEELPAMLVHRGDILKTLLAEIPDSCLHLDAHLDCIDQSETVTAHFRDGQQWQGDLLIGADGLFSKTREVVVPDVQPNYLGDVVWRGIVADDSFCTEGTFIVYVRGRGIYANFFDLGNGTTHWGFFFETPQHSDEVGLPRPAEIGIPPEQLAKLPDRPRAIIEGTPADHITCNFSYDIDPLPRLYSGRVLLIGDAGHAKSPTRARGMTAGFEDALALSRHLSTSSDLDAALAAFQAERLPIVHKYQETSREVSKKIGRSRSSRAKTVIPTPAPAADG